MQHEKQNVLFKCDKNTGSKDSCWLTVHIQEQHNFRYWHTLLDVGCKRKAAFRTPPGCELKEGKGKLSLEETGRKTRNRRV